MKCGFLPVSQESVLIGEVSYHEYYGILVDPEERDLIARNLGPLNKV
jgi:adducin